MLALDREGIPFCTEKGADFSFSPETEEICGRTNARHDITVPNISYRITDDNNVEIKAEIRLRAAVYETCIKKCVVDVQASEDKLREKDKTAALTIYYADEGESLWNIARLYCTSVEAVRLENHMTDDVIQARSMVLIPM